MGISIKSDGAGRNVVEFHGQDAKSKPPEDYDQRLEWIRLSYKRFFEKVLEKDAILRGIAVD